MEPEMRATDPQVLLARISAFLRRRGVIAGVDLDDLVQESVARWLGMVFGSNSAVAAPENALFATARRVWLEVLTRTRRRRTVEVEGEGRSGTSSDPISEVVPHADSAESNAAPVSVADSDLEAAVGRFMGRLLGDRHVALFMRVWQDQCSWADAAVACGLQRARVTPRTGNFGDSCPRPAGSNHSLQHWFAWVWFLHGPRTTDHGHQANRDPCLSLTA